MSEYSRETNWKADGKRRKRENEEEEEEEEEPELGEGERTKKSKQSFEMFRSIQRLVVGKKIALPLRKTYRVRRTSQRSYRGYLNLSGI